jgi:hypothetical protein
MKIAIPDLISNSCFPAVAAAVRALVKTRQRLKADVSLATKIGHSLFPEVEANLIAGVVERNLPFYSANLSHEFIAGMTEFQLNMGMIHAPVPYENIAATQFSHLWNSQE